MLVNTYANKTGKKDEEIIEAMNATTWFTAKEARTGGLVDEVSAAVKIAASFDLTRFGRVPANISGGLTSANQNQPEKVMKNLLKALAESKLVASADVSEDTGGAIRCRFLRSGGCTEGRECSRRSGREIAR